MSSKKTLSIVIPAYQEEWNIFLLYTKLIEVLVPFEHLLDKEFIFICDGSQDRTWEKIQILCEKSAQVKWIRLSRNFWHQAALTAWYDMAIGDAVISMDADLQDPPSVIPEMLASWQEGNEVVYARRKSRDDGFFKKWFAKWYYWTLSILSETKVFEGVGDFRLADRRVIEVFKKLHERDRYIRGMFSWLGFKSTVVEFDRPNRIHGKTGYTWKKMIKLAADGILNFSNLPLKWGAFIGVFMIILSFLFFSWMVFDTARGTVYPLYKWLSVFGFGSMGLQFIFLWIIGEYIGRIYNETRERPIYIIWETINIGD